MVELSTTTSNKNRPNLQAWYRPTFSPEQGILLVLGGSFITGAALAQEWTNSTTLALICAFFALQAEHPLVVQIKQRRSWKPRFLIWGGLYGGIAMAIAGWLYFQSPCLLWIYAMAIAALVADSIAVLKRKQKSILNELIGFTAICLSAPLAYIATTGHISLAAMAMWIVNTLFFSSAIFTLKLRKKKTSSPVPGMIYHGTAVLIILSLYCFNCLNIATALSYTVALVKLVAIACQLDWYRTTKFHFVAIFETRFALLYIAIAAISVLPAHLPRV
ncbi:MAG: YwiC-like family protein [Okeania sp. SIO3H1]|uniref:YwiC-like family protein n=1 Tax=Okeania sp. SIO1I7 TaxID=2607772 RepID=UPI0013CD57AE|nr:YwiC-like family protein [Okeania sp. SIO1I7]NEN90396.1 YwiC-like family protein [Okeania sp. SIO3H1]NET29949.1 YwiC-like family protein [Okeania sp. SIO1I7]